MGTNYFGSQEKSPSKLPKIKLSLLDKVTRTLVYGRGREVLKKCKKIVQNTHCVAVALG